MGLAFSHAPVTSSSLGGTRATIGPPGIMGPRIGARSYRSWFQNLSSFIFWKYGLIGTGIEKMPVTTPAFRPMQPVLVSNMAATIALIAAIVVLCVMTVTL